MHLPSTTTPFPPPHPRGTSDASLPEAAYRPGSNLHDTRAPAVVLPVSAAINISRQHRLADHGAASQPQPPSKLEIAAAVIVCVPLFGSIMSTGTSWVCLVPSTLHFLMNVEAVPTDTGFGAGRKHSKITDTSNLQSDYEKKDSCRAENNRYIS